MQRWLAGSLMLILVCATAEAQTCRKEKTNQLGTAGADITISSSAVTIANRNTSRCSLYIHNSGANSMRCRDVTNDGAPTSTAGILFESGDEKTIVDTGQGVWQCIRVTSDTSANVSESLP